MRIKSINLSLVKSINNGEKTVLTGIFKKPTNKSVMVNRLNIDGDEQADLENHGGVDKAVYAYSLDHYPYWKSILEKGALPPGSLGENLTVSGLDESQIYIGDKFIIGDCILEVSQPRVPCFKLGLALDNKKAPRIFTQSAKTGVYFRVLQEGRIKKGDRVSIVSGSGNSVSVEDLFRSVFDKGFEGRMDVVQKAMGCMALSDEWRLILTNRFMS